MISLYRNKNKPWKAIGFGVARLQRHFFFRPGYGCRWFLWAFVPPFYFWRDNSNTRIGFGMFKRAIYIGWTK